MFTRSKGYKTQFGLICQSHSVEDLYSTKDLYSVENLYCSRFVFWDHFPLHFFLGLGVSLVFYFFIFIFFVPFLLFGPLGGP